MTTSTDVLAHLVQFASTARLRPRAARTPAPPRGGGPPTPEVARRARQAFATIVILGGLGAFMAPYVGVLGSVGCTDSGSVLCSLPVFLYLLAGPLLALLVALGLASRARRRARPDGGDGTVRAAWAVWAGSCALWWALLYGVMGV